MDKLNKFLDKLDKYEDRDEQVDELVAYLNTDMFGAPVPNSWEDYYKLANKNLFAADVLIKAIGIDAGENEVTRILRTAVSVSLFEQVLKTVKKTKANKDLIKAFKDGIKTLKKQMDTLEKDTNIDKHEYSIRVRQNGINSVHQAFILMTAQPYDLVDDALVSEIVFHLTQGETALELSLAMKELGEKKRAWVGK